MNSDRVKNQEVLAQIINKQLEEKDTQYWLEVFDSKGVPCGLVGTLPEVIASDQANDLNLIQQTPLRNSDSAKTYRSIRQPMSFDDQTVEAKIAPPGLGEHTEMVLKQVGLGEEEISSLRRSLVIY